MAHECSPLTLIAVKPLEVGCPDTCPESSTPWQEISPTLSSEQAWLDPADTTTPELSVDGVGVGEGIGDDVGSGVSVGDGSGVGSGEDVGSTAAGNPLTVSVNCPVAPES